MKLKYPLQRLNLFAGIRNSIMLFFFFLIMGGSVKTIAQNVLIPDTAFRTYLETMYPACMNAGFLDTTCTPVTVATAMYVYNLSIKDLTGVQYFDNLYILDCSYNLLTTLPHLPLSLEHLNCGNNQITVLPPLPSLSGFSCNNNLLAALPPLPATLDSMDCSHNHLSALPLLPDGLGSISCGFNNLTVLPYLPPELIGIDASYNQIALITPFDNYVFGELYVNVSHNPVECVPPLPDSINFTFCNTGINCLPNFPPHAFLDNCSVLPDTCIGGGGCTVKNISGYSFIDTDNDCDFDNAEQPLPNRIILVNGGQFYLNTNEIGYYSLYNLPPGNYELTQAITYPDLYEITCFGNSQTVTIATSTDSFPDTNFPNHILSTCALNSVDVATPFQRFCSSDNTYSISYRNDGTDSSLNTFIEVKFEPEIIPLSSTLPWSSVNGNVYTFQIGTLEAGGSGSFSITDSVSCDAIVNQTACVQANIYPDSTCSPLNPLWDKSNVIVEGYCNATNDTIVYTVKNASADSMTNFSLVTIYEDDLLLKVDSVKLDGGDSTLFLIPATGKSYRLEAEQSAFHPGKSQPRSFLELCGPSPYSFNQIVPVIQDDADEWVEIDCHTIVASADPNEKSVQPSGIGADHLVTANDELDYIVNFQNTGTDTAFLVTIMDTLDATHLDLTTIQPGSSSSPYTFSLVGAGVAKFIFSNILLPDSNVNEPASHGFVKYKVRQKAGNAVGTEIDNDASIYFDYNNPVITNTAFVTIDSKENIFSSVSDPISFDYNYSLRAWPNPFEKVVYFEVVAESKVKEYRVELYNLMGEKIYQSPVSHSSVIGVNRNHILPGIYFYKIINDEAVIGAGKVIAR